MYDGEGQDRVVILFEDGGRPLPRHRLAMPLKEYAGKLVLKTEWVEALRRDVLVAHLIDTAQPERDVVSPIYNASFSYRDDMEARIDGLELDATNRKFTAQAWHLKYQGYAKRDRRCL